MGISYRFLKRQENLAPRASLTVRARAGLLGGGVTAVAAGALAIGSLAGSASAAAGGGLAVLDSASSPAAAAAAGYQFVEVGSHQDRTFNQLLGINNKGQIAGYFGAGVPGHPNRGYEINAPYAQNDFQRENFPGSAQTQITGLNDTGIEVGFFSTQNKNGNPDNNFGFWRQNGKYHEVNFPTKNNSSPPQNQLLGINDTGTAVGFFNDSAGNSHGYAYNIATKKFKLITVHGAASLTAAAINDKGTVAGFYVNGGGNTVSFTKTHTGKVTSFAVPGASATTALGLNNNGWVVGFYTTGSGNSAATHGFVFLPNGKFITKFDDPKGIGNTTLNGINNENDIVGFYGDAAGNTDGLVAFPPF